MKTPAPYALHPCCRLFNPAACLVAAAALAACQKSVEPVPAAAPAAVPGAPARILGGLQPGDTVTVVGCVLDAEKVCVISVKVTAPPGGTGDACQVDMQAAVSLPKDTARLRWQLAGSDARHNYRFRGAQGNDKPGFGVRLIDNEMYVAAPAPPAPPASTPMRPIWGPRVTEPGAVELSRTVPVWPPRISAYDVYLEYQAKGASHWTACKTWDPLIVSRD